MMLTPEELHVLRLSAELYNAVYDLGEHHVNDVEELALDIHRLQNRIMARLARRVHAEFFN